MLPGTEGHASDRLATPGIKRSRRDTGLVPGFAALHRIPPLTLPPQLRRLSAKTSLHTALCRPRRFPFLATNPFSAVRIKKGTFHESTEGFLSGF